MGAFTTAMIYLCIASCVFWFASKIVLKVVTKKRQKNMLSGFVGKDNTDGLKVVKNDQESESVLESEDTNDGNDGSDLADA